MTSTKRFCLYLIKPSHYDDDGDGGGIAAPARRPSTQTGTFVYT